MKKSLKKQLQGFTLIEVLIVLAIIGLLSSVVLTSFNLVRSKSRDAKRLADIRQINSAIQMYINDIGHAPYVGTYNCKITNGIPNNSQDCKSVLDSNASTWDQLAADLSPYLPKLPHDPQSAIVGQYRYAYIPPSYEPYACSPSCTTGADMSPTNYAIYARKIENTNTFSNFFYSGVPTFGFGSHTSYANYD